MGIVCIECGSAPNGRRFVNWKLMLCRNGITSCVEERVRIVERILQMVLEALFMY